MLTFDKKISIDGVAVIVAAIGFTFWFGAFNQKANETSAVVIHLEKEQDLLTQNQADTAKYLAVVAQALNDKNITVPTPTIGE